MYTCSLVSAFCSCQFSVKQVKFEIYIILCQYSYHSIINFISEINILNCNFLSSSQKSVGYRKYTTPNHTTQLSRN